MEYIKKAHVGIFVSSLGSIEMDTSYSVLLHWTLAVSAILIPIVYWVFFVPWNWTKDLTDVSYNFAVTRDLRRNETKRRAVIGRIRRLRHVGQRDVMPSPYPNGWYAIIESAKVKPGKALSVSCLGEQFVVFRTEKNQLFVLNAYCPHMGANLGVGGKVVGDGVQCPFHAWTFRGIDGMCDSIPYSKCAKETVFSVYGPNIEATIYFIPAIPQNAKVRKWISLEANDCVFVWYHAENATPWQLPIATEIAEGDFVYHGRNDYHINCHIQDIPENGADLAHFEAIHKSSFLAGGDSENSPLAGLGSHQWEAVWRPSETDDKHIATVLLKHAVVIQNIKLCTIRVRAEQIGPSYVRLHLDTIFGKVLILQTTCPVDPILQNVIHRFYAPRILAPFMKFLIWGESVMFERDVNIWNHKTFTQTPCLVKEDRNIKLFRNWFSQFYSKNSKPFEFASNSLEW